MRQEKLVKIWIYTVLALLVIIFYELVILSDFANLLYWIRIATVLSMIIFTFYIVYMRYTNKNLLKNEQWYAAELRRKDQQIEELKREKDLLFNTSLKQSENAAKWSDYAKRLEKQIKH